MQKQIKSAIITATTEKPTIIFFFISIPSAYQPFLAIAFLPFFAFLTGTFPFAVNTKTAEIINAAIILNKQVDTFQCTAES